MVDFRHRRRADSSGTASALAVAAKFVFVTCANGRIHSVKQWQRTPQPRPSMATALAKSSREMLLPVKERTRAELQPAADRRRC